MIYHELGRKKETNKWWCWCFEALYIYSGITGVARDSLAPRLREVRLRRYTLDIGAIYTITRNHQRSLSSSLLSYTPLIRSTHITIRLTQAPLIRQGNRTPRPPIRPRIAPEATLPIQHAPVVELEPEPPEHEHDRGGRHGHGPV
jgi:hypothetical protein